MRGEGDRISVGKTVDRVEDEAEGNPAVGESLSAALSGEWIDQSAVQVVALPQRIQHERRCAVVVRDGPEGDGERPPLRAFKDQPTDLGGCGKPLVRLGEPAVGIGEPEATDEGDDGQDHQEDDRSVIQLCKHTGTVPSGRSF